MFSVVIPTYNYAHYVSQAIDSALGQDGDDFEVVVIDDGSTDNTIDVLKRYGARIRWHTQAHAGASAARNRGAEMALGRWVLFLDADDQLRAGALGHFRQAISAAPDAAAVIARHCSVGDDGSARVSRRNPVPANPLTNFRRFVDRQLKMCHGEVVIQRDVCQAIRYPVGVGNGEDLVFFGQLLARYPVAVIDDAVVNIVAHAGRMRQNVAALDDSGLKPVEALFQTDLLPPAAMRLRGRFAARYCLDLARIYHRAGRPADSLRYALRAMAFRPTAYWSVRRCWNLLTYFIASRR